jgi:flagellar assembly factor FliW
MLPKGVQVDISRPNTEAQKSVRIRTTRFGHVQITDSDILNFPEGILGFNDLKRFVLLDDPNDDIFAWLQACDDEAIAFPVLEPELFAAEFRVNASKADLEALQMPSLEGSRMFSIVTIPEDPTKMTGNLKAPVIINIQKRIGRQCVLQDNNLAIREPIFQKLQQRVVAHPDLSIKAQSQALDVAVRLPSELGL